VPLLYLIIHNRVPTIHKQPTEPHFANDTDSNCSTFLMLLVTLTLTVLDIDPSFQLIPRKSANINHNSQHDLVSQPEVPVPNLKPVVFLGFLYEPNTVYSQMSVLILKQLY
jgi:hypothetical protein